MKMTFRFLSRAQYAAETGRSVFGTRGWIAVDGDMCYLKGFYERVLPPGRYWISDAPKTGKFKLVRRSGYESRLYRRVGRGWPDRRIRWEPVMCSNFCRGGVRAAGLKVGRTFNVIPVRRGK